jgi:hypothetical protein
MSIGAWDEVEGRLQPSIVVGEPSTVFVLGAGFSKAISADMPLVSGLGEELSDVLARLQGTATATFPPTPDAELLLTSLAADQPFLTESENLRNRALFLEVSGWLGLHLFECQQHVLGSSLPGWLAELVTAWHRRRATVITLNYDTLIESAVQTLGLTDTDGRLTTPSHTYQHPVAFEASGRADADRYDHRDSLRISKLHGSLSWYRTSEGQVVDLELWKDTFNSGQRMTASDLAARTIGLDSPLIVPPVLVKDGQLDHRVVRTNWRRAHEALANATTIAVLGYSMPTGDSQMASLLGTNLRDKQTVVVDLEPQPIVKRLATTSRWQLGAGVIQPYDADNPDSPIPDFAHHYAGSGSGQPPGGAAS